MMKALFIGAVEFSKQALLQLIEMSVQLVGVCTLEQSVFHADHCDLSGICLKNGISWCYAPDINAIGVIQWIADKKPDVIFCFGWSKLLSSKILAIPPLGVIGFHPAALPMNRGRHPIIWALVLGLCETASTFFLMTENVDDGDIISQVLLPILEEDNASTLYEKITQCALQQIREFVPVLSLRQLIRTPQNTLLANTWRKRCYSDGKIDWRMSAKSVYNLTRGLSKPYIGAHCFYRQQEIKVWESRMVSYHVRHIEPGKILDVTAESILIKCAEDAVALLSTEPKFFPVRGEYLE